MKCVRENAKKIMHYHKNHWPHIKSLNYPIEFTRDEFNFYEENFKADFSVDMNAENDWLAFDVDCYLGKDRISLEDLKNYLKNKKPHFLCGFFLLFCYITLCKRINSINSVKNS